mmetsp:Transcript_15416/g.30729  ORF Transcript_15416/g.30729 Transcript_15416/m.30729 type:complete len:414 (+) Transcript_15416:300-1541(+)
MLPTPPQNTSSTSSSEDVFMDAVNTPLMPNFSLSLPQHSSHTFLQVESSSSADRHLHFNDMASFRGTRITTMIYDKPERGSAAFGMKENVLVCTEPGRHPKAYWLYKKLKGAIYGKVAAGYELQPYSGPPIPGGEAAGQAWEVTGRMIACKMLSWASMNANRARYEEDPLKEIACMQFLTSRPRTDNVMKHIVALSDNRYMYSVMEYAEGGELFDKVEESGKFTEPRARHWFRHILSGLATLQSAGICHRDLSLENLMVSHGKTLIIDMGMCVRVPFVGGDGVPRTSVDGGSIRKLILPITRCGKPNYMSPEIVDSTVPFDGFSIDLWAAGVILFIMLTGVPPFDRAQPGDARFHMTAMNGRLREMLEGWGMAVSDDAAELLQAMLRADPRQRPTLEQVCGHPWVQNSDVDEP